MYGFRRLDKVELRVLLPIRFAVFLMTFFPIVLEGGIIGGCSTFDFYRAFNGGAGDRVQTNELVFSASVAIVESESLPVAFFCINGTVQPSSLSQSRSLRCFPQRLDCLSELVKSLNGQSGKSLKLCGSLSKFGVGEHGRTRG